MARPKQIEDDVLLDLIKKFFNDECRGNIKKLKDSMAELMDVHFVLENRMP